MIISCLTHRTRQTKVPHKQSIPFRTILKVEMCGDMINRRIEYYRLFHLNNITIGALWEPNRLETSVSFVFN